MSARLGAGSLRDTITIERQSSSDNGRGGSADTWAPYLSDVPAVIETQRGGEAVQAKRLLGTTPVLITIRYTTSTAAITSDDRVVTSAGIILSIGWAGCLDVGRPRWITLQCTSGTVAQR